MRSVLQLLGGVAVAGVVAAGSTAFTAAGLTTTGSGTANFAGGKAAVTVNGAIIDDIDYRFADANKTQIDQITLHFANTNSEGATVAVTPTGGGSFASTGFTCGNISSQTSVCSGDTWTVPLGSLTITVV